MKWIVLEENPNPDQYIAVIAVDEERFLRIESKPCSKFLTSYEALVRARELKEMFNVKSIRIFIWKATRLLFDTEIERIL